MTEHLPYPPPRPYGELRSLREDTVLSLPRDGSVVLQGPWGGHRLRRPAECVREALRRMSYGPVSLGNVVADYPAWDVAGDAPLSTRARGLRDQLAALAHCVVGSLATDGGRLLLSVVPLIRGEAAVPRPGGPDERYRLSRHVWVRAEKDGLRLESPMSGSRLEVHGDALRLLGALPAATRPGGTTVQAVAHGVADRLPEATVRACLAYLVATGMVLAASPDPVTGRVAFAEDEDRVYGASAARRPRLYRASRAAGQVGEAQRGWYPMFG